MGRGDPHAGEGSQTWQEYCGAVHFPAIRVDASSWHLRNTVAGWQHHSLRAAPITATPAHLRRDSRPTVDPVIPPNAIAGPRAECARPLQRTAPNAMAPGWLGVAKAGDRNTQSTRPRAARTSSARPCADAVRNPAPCRTIPPRRGKCRPIPAWFSPAWPGMAPPPTITTANRRSRQTATARRSAAGSAAAPGRSTSPHNPFGRRRRTGAGSGSRSRSENTHSVGSPVRCVPRARALTARAQAMSF